MKKEYVLYYYDSEILREKTLVEAYIAYQKEKENDKLNKFYIKPSEYNWEVEYTKDNCIYHVPVKIYRRGKKVFVKEVN